MLVSKTIPGFFGGVSQQAPSLRLDTQCEALSNGYTTLQHGLIKRPNTEYVATLSNKFKRDTYTHKINRDMNERYIVIFTGEQEEPLEIYNFDGEKCAVRYGHLSKDLEFTPNETLKEYLFTDKPNEKIRATTIADYTIITNKDVTPQMEDETAPVPPPVAFVYVEKGQPSTDYTVKINSVEVTHTTKSQTDDKPASSWKTTNIAAELASLLRSKLDNKTWIVTRSNNLISIKREDGADFSFEVHDSFGDTAMKGFKGVVQKFADLPAHITTGETNVVVTIEGDVNDKYSSYYLTYDTNDKVWKETVKPGMKNRFNKATMPHRLVRTGVNEFTFSDIEWAERSVGNEHTAPEPSFIGQPINDVFFFKNRLGFLAGENVVLSKAGEYFDFFPTTGTEVLDDDPLDHGVSTTQVNILYHAIAYNKQLLLFSDQEQFISSSGDSLFTPKTASFNSATKFTTSSLCKPLGLGANVYFVVPKGNYSTIREYYVQSNSMMEDAYDITAHVPDYLPRDIKTLTGSTSDTVMFAFSPREPKTVFVYKYHWNGEEKVQSSWSRWDFSNEISDIIVIDNYLYMIINETGKTVLSRMNIEKITTGSLGFRVHLDNLCEVQGEYDEEREVTVWKLPYETDLTDYTLVRSDNGLSVPNVVKTSLDTFEAEGDHSDVPCYAGVNYVMRYRFTEWTIRDSSELPETASRLQIRSLTLGFTNTSYFRIEVTPVRRDVVTHVFKVGERTDRIFTGIVLDVTRLGTPSLISHEETFLMMVNSKGCIIELVNDSYLPSEFQTAGFEGYFVKRARRI